ncbi:DivIVA domain-containing protein [Weissella kandleri]|uniref:DivIVA domain-containing protein n=1 Tax=Weissella kandleri TaxID=1616 RepID=UPI00387EBE79
MALTPQEIHSKDFTSRGRGFDKVEVNDFLDQIVIDFENLINENQTLKTKVADAEANAQQVEEMKQSVNSSILIAQEAAERLKKQTESEVEATRNQAEEQAQKIVLDATTKANSVLTDANQKAAQTKQESDQEIQKLTAEKDALTQEMAAFKEHLVGVLQNQIDLVNGNPDWQKIGRSEMPASNTTAESELADNGEPASMAASEASTVNDSEAEVKSEKDDAFDFEAAVQAKLAEFSNKDTSADNSKDVDTVVVLPEDESNRDQILNKE